MKRATLYGQVFGNGKTSASRGGTYDSGIIEVAREYIFYLGGFEKFAECGLF